VIFLTVGTYPLPFDRLVVAVDAAVGKGLVKEQVFAQIGHCTYKPRNMEYVALLEKEVFDDYFKRSSGVISHAGMGTITIALGYAKPLVVMPRLRRYGEIVNDHQTATARKFGELGHILVAYSPEELPEVIRRLKDFVPRPRQANPKAVADRIGEFIRTLLVK